MEFSFNGKNEWVWWGLDLVVKAYKSHVNDVI